jgi:hypothetical protein
MPILAAGQRRYLIDKKLVYLFSYDLAWPATGDATFAIIMVPGGARLESHLKDPEQFAPMETRLAGLPPLAPGSVYHVHDDISVEGNDTITGTVNLLRDSVFLPHGDRAGVIEGAIIITTSDGAVIDARYKGSIAVGTLGLQHFDMGNGGGVTRARFFTTPRFDSCYGKYKWLTERQCAGFGYVDIKDGRPREGSVDIYALKSDSER